MKTEGELLSVLMEKVAGLDNRRDENGELMYVTGPGTLWVTKEVFESLNEKEQELVGRYGGVDHR